MGSISVAEQKDHEMAVDATDDGALLLAVARQRDRGAHNTLFERYSVEAYNWALRFTRNAPLAEEAVQEAMLFIWLHADQFDGQRDPRILAGAGAIQFPGVREPRRK